MRAAVCEVTVCQVLHIYYPFLYTPHKVVEVYYYRWVNLMLSDEINQPVSHHTRKGLNWGRETPQIIEPYWV